VPVFPARILEWGGPLRGKKSKKKKKSDLSFLMFTRGTHTEKKTGSRNILLLAFDQRKEKKGGKKRDRLGSGGEEKRSRHTFGHVGTLTLKKRESREDEKFSMIHCPREVPSGAVCLVPRETGLLGGGNPYPFRRVRALEKGGGPLHRPTSLKRKISEKGQRPPRTMWRGKRVYPTNDARMDEKRTSTITRPT